MGLIGKAIAGAAGAVQDVGMEAIRAEIMAQRDATLNQYADKHLDRQIQAQADTNAANREAEAPLRAAQASNLQASAEKTNTEVRAIREAEQMYKQFQSTTDPKERERLSDAVRARLGKDKADQYVFMPLKDDLGNVVDYKAYNKSTGRPLADDTKPAAPGGGKPSGKDYSDLWAGGSQPSAAPEKAPKEKSAADTSPGFEPERSGDGLGGVMRKVGAAIAPKGGAIATDAGEVSAQVGSKVTIGGKEYVVGSISGGVAELRPVGGGSSRRYKLKQSGDQ